MKTTQAPSVFSDMSPLFLIGIARSGTTLLQSLLDGHPQLLVDVADSRFVFWYKHYYRWMDAIHTWRDDLQKRIDLAEAIMISYIFNEPSQYYQDFLSWISIQRLKACFRELVCASPAKPKDYLESYFHALGLASGGLSSKTLFWVDKTLSYEYLFYRYLQWWPNARFIFMVRDPRDIYSSYKKRDIKNNRPVTSIESFAVTWSNSVHALHDCQRLVARENYYILHYEDLVHSPRETMQSIAQFLGIKMAPGLLEPTKGFGRVPWGGNPESGKKQTGVIYHAAAQKWTQILQPEEISRLEGLLKHEMEIAGYQPSSQPQRFSIAAVNVFMRLNFFRLLNLGL